MMEIFGTTMGAFFLYLLVLPLIGLVVGVLFRVLTPYWLFGCFLYALLETFAIETTAWSFWLPLLTWCALTLAARQWSERTGNAQFRWFEGHVSGVMLLLTLGLYPVRKNALLSNGVSSDLATSIVDID